MKYKTSDHEKYVEEYDRLYELFEQDPQEAVYAVMDLEKENEKLESKLYPLMHAKNLINALKPNGNEDRDDLLWRVKNIINKTK